MASSSFVERRLVWEGCFNVRELGMHPTVDGHQTRTGVVVRSDTRDRLTDAGWEALRGYGVTTIIDLRDPAEYPQSSRVPEGIDLIELPALDMTDDRFWGDGRWRDRGHSGEFYVAVLERWPDRFAGAVSRIVRAKPGVVMFHCQAGRDRAGLLAASLLALAGVSPDAIADDYALSAPCLQPLYERWASEAPNEQERARILRANSSEREAMVHVLEHLDLGALLGSNGVAEEDLRALRERFVG